MRLRMCVAFAGGPDDGDLADDRPRIRIRVPDHHPVDGRLIDRDIQQDLFGQRKIKLRQFILL